jgi:hypothetical protein
MNSNLTRLDASVHEILATIVELCEEETTCASAAELLKYEEKVVEAVQRLASALVGRTIQQSLDSEPVKAQARRRAAACPKRMRNRGRRPVTLQLRCGVRIVVFVDYYSRSVNANEKRNRGLYPGLGVLGIICGQTPAALRQVSQLVSLSSSLEEARMLLQEQGFRLSVASIRRLVYYTAALVRAAQKAGTATISGTLEGKNVVISIDGGRIRIRKNKRQRTKKGRLKYRTDWREPKLLIIYVADAEGRMDRKFPPIIDGTLGGPDHAFELLRHYLQQLGVSKADRVLFVADGARWIWCRARKLLRSLNIPQDRCYELVDFYHAVEYLGHIADSQRAWKPTQRKRWIKTQKKRLLRGEIGAVMDEIDEVIGPRPTKDQKRWRNYFQRNGITNRRMDYARVAKQGLPIGSGAMESAIRRILNLRLKGPSIFWHEQNAEAILLQRAWHKTGRSQDLLHHAFEGNFAIAL